MDIRAFVVGGKVVASMKRQSLDDDFRSNLHQGGEGKVIRLTDEERKKWKRETNRTSAHRSEVPPDQNVGGVLIHNSEVSVRPGFFQRCGIELSK